MYAESNIKIFITDEYNRFKKMPGNRIVSKMRIEKLKASFGERDIPNPIICNENMEIVDGQGRYEARKELGLPIVLIIVPGLGTRECAQLNRFNTKWGAGDWVDSYAQNSDPEVALPYQRLKQVSKETGFSYSRCIDMVGHSSATGRGGKQSIESGRIIFTEDDVAKVIITAKNGAEIREALQFTAPLNNAFWLAVRVMVGTKGYDHSRMLRNCAMNRGSYNQMSNLEAQLKEFSRIFNYKRSAGKIYFEDYMRNKGRNVRSYDKNAFTHDYYMPDASTLEVRA